MVILLEQSDVAGSVAFAGGGNGSNRRSVVNQDDFLGQTVKGKAVILSNIAGCSYKESQLVRIVEASHIQSAFEIVLCAQSVKRAVPDVVPNQLACVDSCHHIVTGCGLVLKLVKFVFKGENLVNEDAFIYVI